MKLKKILVMGLAILGLIGCSGEEDTNRKVGGNSKNERSLVVASGNFNGDFYNGWTNSIYDANIKRLVWGEGLMTKTPAGKLVKSQWVDSLVTTKSDPSKKSEDIWTFKIKDGMKFSNGNPLTVKDVKFTYDFYMDEKALNDTGATDDLNEFMDKIEVDETANTIKFHLKEVIYMVDSTFEYFVLDSNTIVKNSKKEGITPQQWVKANMSSPIGYGPYKIDKFVPSQYVKLSINNNYQGNYEGDKPNIKEIILQNTPTETKLTQLITGEIDIATGISKEEDVDAVLGQDTLQTNRYYRHGTGQLTFHTDFGPVQLKEVRKAIAYSFDRIKYKNIIVGKNGLMANAPYSRSMWMMYDDDEKIGTESRLSKTYTDYDILDANGKWDEQANIKEAHKYLDQAANKTDGKYAKLTKVSGNYLWEGKPLEINMALTAGVVDAYNLIFTKEVQKEFGIKINMDSMDWSVLAKSLYGSAPLSERRYHIFATSTNFATKTDYNFYKKSYIIPYGSGVTSNVTRFPINEEILNRMRIANPSTKEGDQQYKEAFRDYMKVLNEEIPLLPTFSSLYFDTYADDITDFDTTPMWSFPYAIVKAKFKSN